MAEGKQNSLLPIDSDELALLRLKNDIMTGKSGLAEKLPKGLTADMICEALDKAWERPIPWSLFF